jgi:hypothetical protein
VRDVSTDIGGDIEQRAQSDLTLEAYILPDSVVVPSVESLTIGGSQKDSAGTEIIDTEIEIPRN